jgi:hypothetical protein
MDGDGTDDGTLYTGDLDDDNDGMPDVYETNYGVINGGWQNPYVYNARYAMLIGSTKRNEDSETAFRNDFGAMYDKLKGYGYNDKNIYASYDLENPATSFGSRYGVDGPAIQNDALNEGPNEFTIEDGISEIGTKITKNDFIFVVVMAHGNVLATNTGQYFEVRKRWVKDGVLTPDWSHFYSYELGTYINNNFGNTATNKKYARLAAVIQTSYSGAALQDLRGEYRILISAANGGEPSHTKLFTPGTSPTHWAFIYEGRHRWGIWDDVTIPGFIRNMGDINNPQSLRNAYDAGYNAATSNWDEGYRVLGWWVRSPVDARSTPQIEDTNSYAAKTYF